jgi:hypothetical protein
LGGLKRGASSAANQQPRQSKSVRRKFLFKISGGKSKTEGRKYPNLLRLLSSVSPYGGPAVTTYDRRISQITVKAGYNEAPPQNPNSKGIYAWQIHRFGNVKALPRDIKLIAGLDRKLPVFDSKPAFPIFYGDREVKVSWPVFLGDEGDVEWGGGVARGKFRSVGVG